MQIAVLSDIHDHVQNLAVALGAIGQADCLICCGDLCSPFIVDQLARGFPKPIHIVFGNNDADLFRITAKTARYPNLRLRGEFFEEEFEGRRIAVNHFDNIATAISRAGHHDAVFFGHNHIFQNARASVRTLLLNPGSIMGCQLDAEANQRLVPPTFALYDTATNTAQGYRIVNGAVELHS
ncbi:MAG: metallophosphatase family protein [Bryobacteraceae bacterium]|nr:metallophosphatase family protein [Bryobacteraceae bacterium]MDW8378174.1 metallophosphoesterase family protein [Bryobacterales bacterium]